MSDFIKRLSNEAGELNKKLEGLRDFIKSDKFEEVDKGYQEILVKQFFYMEKYSLILKLRLTIHMGDQEILESSNK